MPFCCPVSGRAVRVGKIWLECLPETVCLKETRDKKRLFRQRRS